MEKQPVRVAQAAGFSVHLFTASGGAVAVLALYAAIERNFATCFAWLGLALFIDGIDGALAAPPRCARRPPRSTARFWTLSSTS